ncbi:hypothetical protein KP509_31G073500 [Ceratopteris richardii]|uniref:Uncharacterized protein n=1 Tax=Ceratopteris richardii TaxID=49495 RepID=A0A8T2QZG8_CERRI|nr:hypothetical protein KP509_31G073500 [Ceratopteris richardii]
MEARNTGASNTEHDIEGSLKWCLDAVRECSSTLPGTTSFGNVGDLDGLHDLIGVSFDKNRSAGAFLDSQSNLSAESSHNVLHNDESDFSLAAFAPLLNGSDDVIEKRLASLQEDLNELLHGCSPLPVHTNNPISSLTHNGDISEMGTSGSEPSTWFSMFLQSFECGVADIPATSPLIDFDHRHPDARHSQAILSNYAAEGDGVIHLDNNPEKQRLLAAASSYCTFIEKSEGKVLQHRCTKVPRIQKYGYGGG